MSPLLDARSLLAECFKAGMLWIQGNAEAQRWIEALQVLADDEGVFLEVTLFPGLDSLPGSYAGGWVVVAR